MKIVFNLCLHFARQDGQDGKNWKENDATKVTIIPETKRRKYGMNKTLVLQQRKLRYITNIESKIDLTWISIEKQLDI